MASWGSLQVQMAYVIEVLTKTALAEMTKLVDDASAEFRWEISRSQRENEALKSKLLVMEGELRAARGCGEGTPDSSASEVKVCDEFKEAYNSHVSGKGSSVAVERVFEEYVLPVEKKEAVPISMDLKYESVDEEQVSSKSVLLSKDWLEEDLKMSQSQPGQKILSETSCGSLGAATAAANGGEGPVCDKEEVHMQPCPAGDPEKKGLRAELKQEPEWEEQHFDSALPLLGSVDQGQEFPLGMVSEEHGRRGGSARVEESFDASVEAESTSVAAAANAAVGPLGKEEAELHLQPCPAGDPEKGLQAELKQKQEGEPLTPGHSLPGSAEGFEVQCVRSKTTRSGKVQEMPRRHRGSLEDGGVWSNDQFSPRHFRVSRRLCSEKNEGPTSHLEQQQNGRPHSILEKHQRIHCRKKPFACSGCDKTFSHHHVLQAHQCAHQCIARRDTLKTHQRLHTGEKPHLCDECGKRFNRLGSLKIHQWLHTGEKPYICDVCGKSFVHMRGLTAHQRVHTGEKPYCCDDCGKCFAQLSNFKSHRRVHTREKPFSCDECGRSFGHLPSLKTHRRLHTGEKPYSCDECGKSFTQLSNFKTHRRVHTREKPFRCDECGMSFSIGSNLKIHQRVHTGEKPYSCDECGKSFAQLGSLTTHQKRSHTGKKPR